MMRPILYLTGRGGDHTKGLGGYISSLTDNFHGLSIDVPFLRKDIQDQINTIQHKFLSCAGGTVISNSYGAYLTLLSLIDFDHTLEQAILLSPVLGTAKAKDRMYFSRPPAAKRLENAVKDKRVNLPENSAIFMGTNDELYDPLLLETFKIMMGNEKVFELDGQGHDLDKDVVADIIRLRLNLSN